MKTSFCLFACFAAASLFGQSTLTIYNQDFGVVRDTVHLNLKPGENSFTYSGVTVHLEPDSVVLRDPTGHIPVTILEQSYRADPATSGLLLAENEGKEIDFLVRDQDGHEHTVRGRIIRSGYTPNTAGMSRYGMPFYAQQESFGSVRNGAGSPIIEVDGKLRFSLPGEPLFPSLGNDAILKPTLNWKLYAKAAANFDAELSYITGGMSWLASYNLIAPEKGDILAINGWVAIDNQSGRAFDQAEVKLMAGTVNRLHPTDVVQLSSFEVAKAADTGTPPVSEKTFDEYHLYSIGRPLSLRNRETKQVEFVRSDRVRSKTLYVYDGADLSPFRGQNLESVRGNADFGTKWNPHIWVMREFENSSANGLGLPLPRGRVRFYRRDDADGRLEFTGENLIDHTPRDETIRLYSGDAFDLVGQRRQTAFAHHRHPEWTDEAFEIHLRNHKTAPVDVRVEERLYRSENWAITEESTPHEKIDSDHVRFNANVPAAGEIVVTYRVHYTAKAPAGSQSE